MAVSGRIPALGDQEQFQRKRLEMTEETFTGAPTPTTAAAIVHDSDSTRIYATLHAPVMKEFCLEATREDEGGNWYIEVTDEGGYHTYDGYWRDSASKTADEVLREAVSGSLLDEVSAPPVDAQPICTADAEREQLRAQQAAAVMPQIGPLLDAWEGIDNDTKGTIREEAPELAKWLGAINRAMVAAAPPTPSPL